jgi:hypothetical protein
MNDLAQHEAIVGLALRLGDPAFVPPGLYALNVGHPNQLWHFVAWALAALVGSTWAAKLLIALSIFFTPIAFAHAARHFGKHPSAALLVTPFAIGWLYYWGLVANLLSIPLLLAALPLIDTAAGGSRAGQAESPVGAKRYWDAAAAAVAFLVLYLAHQATMGVALLAYGIFSFVYAVRDGLSVRTIVARVLPLVPVGALSVAQWVHQVRLAQYMTGPADPGPSFLQRIMLIPGLLFSGHGAATYGLFALTLAAVGWSFALGRRQEQAKASTLLERSRIAIAALAVFAAYLIFPSTLREHTLVFHRFLPLGWTLFSLAASPPASAALPRLYLPALATLPLASLLLNWPQFAAADRAYSELDTLIEKIEPGQSVYLMETVGRGDRLFALSGAGAHVVARKGGRLPKDFTDIAISLVHRNAACVWGQTGERLGLPHQSIHHFRPALDFRRFRYLFIHAPPDRHDALAYAMGKHAERVAASGDWILFASMHQVVPPCAADWYTPRLPASVADLAGD